MNIENHFNTAEAYLEMANEKMDNLDYDSALAALVKAYEHTRALIELVFEMKRESEVASGPAGEDTG